LSWINILGLLGVNFIQNLHPVLGEVILFFQGL